MRSGLAQDELEMSLPAGVYWVVVAGHRARCQNRRRHTVPITSAPVDQAAFTRMMLVQVEPKVDRETGVQYTSKDGTQKKWTVQVVASLPSRFDSGRTDSEVLPVTVTCTEDPRDSVAEGDPVRFTDLTAGVMAPEQDRESGRIRGGRLFWTASGVSARAVKS
jgi:hypothetical protein